MDTFSCDYFSLIYRQLVSDVFIKTHVIMFIFTNIHKSYVYNPLSPYILLVNKSIDSIISYWTTLLIIYINIKVH